MAEPPKTPPVTLPSEGTGQPERPPLPPPSIFREKNVSRWGLAGSSDDESLRETIDRAVRESEAAMAKAPPPSVNIQALADKAVLGMCELLGLLFGLPFGEDLYHHQSISGWHWFYLAIGVFFAGAGPMFPWIRTRTWIPESISASLSRGALDARIWIAALLLLFAYGIGPELYQRATKPSAPPTVIHESPSAEDIPKATAPIQAELDATKRKIADLDTQLAEKNRDLEIARQRSIAMPLGPLTTLEIRQRLAEKGIWKGGPHATPSDFRWAVVTTTPQDNQVVAELLYRLMKEAGLEVQSLEVTDHSVNLDAPDFPKPGAAGITFHGDDVLTQRFFRLLGPCLTVRTTTKMLDGLQEWYSKRVAQGAKILWIEIGNGSPWIGERSCWQ